MLHAIDAIDFWDLTTYDEMSFVGHVQMVNDFADVSNPNTWPVDDDFPCRQYVSLVETEGSDYKLEYRPYNFWSDTTGYSYVAGTDWSPWPGERILDEPEFPYLVGASTRERLLIRFTISGGNIQGKLKAAEFKIEGIKKTHREIIAVGTSGTVVDLTGKGFPRWTLRP